MSDIDSMSDKEPISILTAPAKIHYVAIVIFAILFGLFYVFKHTEYFKYLKDILNQWGFTLLNNDDDVKSNEGILDEIST